MPIRPQKTIMTADQFREILLKNNMRQSDAAWLCGVGMRHARAWALGEYQVPQYARLLLTAYNDGLLPAGWLIKHVGKPVP